MTESSGKIIPDVLRNTFEIEVVVFDGRQNTSGIAMLDVFVVFQSISVDI